MRRSSYVEQAIRDGRLTPGDRLPSEREPAAEHHVSRMTVRQALQTLESRGLLRRAVGVDRTAYDSAGLAVETALDLFRGDRTRIVAWRTDLRVTA